MSFCRTFILLCVLIGITILANAQNLPRYSSLVDRVELETWVLDSTRSFDKNGIVLTNSHYVAVGISQYGLLCLDRFEESQDSVHLNHAIEQLSYFQNDSLVNNMFQGKGLGLPVNFEYKGIKPPWYSGMGQGMAISFLLRYAETTADTSVYDLVRRINFTMLQPQEAGGCISRTPEGLYCIEEYPNTSQSPQVLNGFIFALFGLQDYCLTFPEDRRSSRILKSCMASLKASLPFYDTRKWTKYNRRTLYPNRVDYIRIQIFQMRQLYAYTADPYYLRQACIWAAYIQGQPSNNPQDWKHFEDEDIIIIGSWVPGRARFPEGLNLKRSEFEDRRLTNGPMKAFPWYGMVISKKEYSDKPVNIEFELERGKSDEVHILYRYNWDEQLFTQEKWQAKNGVSAFEHKFTIQPGYYQFAIFVRLDGEPLGIDINMSTRQD